MSHLAGLAQTSFVDYGLSAFTLEHSDRWGPLGDLRENPSHTHLELEIHFVQAGAVTLDFAGREERLTQGDLLAFWGGLPHRDVDPEPPTTTYYVAQVPIVNVLTWAGSAEVLDRLLGGELLHSEATTTDATADQLAFARWTSDLAANDPRLRTAVEMEIQARLLRLLNQSVPRRAELAPRAGAASADLVSRAIQYVTRHFVEEMTIDDIAQAIDRNHDHLMTTFRRVCGLTLWDYVTRLRLSEAQRLLTATDLPILAVCHRSGFSSQSRLYDAFHRYCGQTPSAFRRRMSQ